MEKSREFVCNVTSYDPGEPCHGATCGKPAFINLMSKCVRNEIPSKWSGEEMAREDSQVYSYLFAKEIFSITRRLEKAVEITILTALGVFVHNFVTIQVIMLSSCSLTESRCSSPSCLNPTACFETKCT